jgi:hypothetical protein
MHKRKMYAPNIGIMSRMCKELYKAIEEDEEKKYIRTEVTVTFVEICQEQIRDLLVNDRNDERTPLSTTNPSARRPSVRENENVESGVKDTYIENVVRRECKTIQDVLKVILEGTSKRSQQTTNMNERSSRSHAVFTLELDRIDMVGEDEGGSNDGCVRTKSKVHLVDLAGSERAKATGAVGK